MRVIARKFGADGPYPVRSSSQKPNEALVQALIATGSVATKIYWDVRLSERFKTVEFRVTDVCMTVDEAVMVAGLTRMVRTCYDKRPRRTVLRRPELVRAAHWRAARYGLDTELIDIGALAAVPAPELIEKFWLSCAHRWKSLENGTINCARNTQSSVQAWTLEMLLI